jgi:biopolymer transport protein ExbD
MSMKGGGFDRKSKASSEVPASSLADIAFLLLIFFMVTTVFQSDSNRPIEWPEAEAAMKIDEKQKNILNIWMERNGTVFMNDQPFTMPDVSAFVGPLYSMSERSLVISIRSDRLTPYIYVDQLQQELVEAGVVRVVFATQLEQSMQRERR